jgi:hypothetical protein
MLLRSVILVLMLLANQSALNNSMEKSSEGEFETREGGR